MRPIANVNRLLTLIAASLLIAACGGGRTDESESPEVSLQMFGPVVGLGYTTPTHQGVTRSDGSFDFEPGESVVFELAGLPLGESVPAEGRMTLEDLFPGAAVPTTGAEVQDFFDHERGPNQATVRFLNALSLLRALDQDKDTANGIQIHPDLIVENQGNPVDLDEGLANFQHTVRAWMHHASAQGWVADASWVLWAVTLDHYAAWRGLDPQVFVPDRSRYATNPDQWKSITHYTVDPNGWVVAKETDVDADGSLDVGRQFAYDALGRQTRSGYDANGDGVMESSQTNEFDAEGRKVLVTGHAGGNVAWVRTLEYGPLGELTYEAYDTGPDGTLDEIETYEFNAAGRETFYRWDDGADGTFDRIQETFYDARGYDAGYRLDRDGDGAPDHIVRRENDANGNVTLETVDVTGNGTPDKTIVSEWDAEGRLLSRYFDEGATSATPRHEFYTYDAQGRLTRHETDSDGNGTIDRIQTTTYDDATHTQVDYIDNGGDGVTDRTLTETFDAQGRILLRQLDFAANPSQVTTYVYDDDGLLIRTDYNGSPNRVLERDEHGNVLSEVAHKPTGVLTYRADYTYVRSNFAGRATAPR